MDRQEETFWKVGGPSRSLVIKHLSSNPEFRETEFHNIKVSVAFLLVYLKMEVGRYELLRILQYGTLGKGGIGNINNKCI